MRKRQRLAIIGSGISGLSAAYYLQHHFDVHLFERESRLGGHSRTISFTHQSGREIDVDTGFIVLNDQTYPLLNQLFDELSIELTKTEMSFSVASVHSGLEWSSEHFFAQRHNLLNGPMLRGAVDIIRFNRRAQSIVEQYPELSVSELCDHMGMSHWFKENYLLPMGGAIWSSSTSQMQMFPATTLVQFFANHGLLNLYQQPQWYTLTHKSQAYIKALQSKLDINITTQANIQSIKTDQDGVSIRCEQPQSFDYVLFACHPVEILDLLEHPQSKTRKVLAQFRRQKNLAVTHGDTGLLPSNQRCWSSWNYLVEDNHGVCVNYWMNKLQHIPADSPVIVSLNPSREIDEQSIIDQTTFYHPIYDLEAIAAQAQLKHLQGEDRLWYCGAYLRYGFHEDGIWSALDVINAMAKDQLITR